jgi:hypothetical protein
VALEAKPMPSATAGHPHAPSVIVLSIQGNYRDDDGAIKARLEQLGLTVTVAFDIHFGRAQAEEYDLLFMSSCASPRQIAPDLREADVPMIVCDPGSFPGVSLVEPLGEEVAHGSQAVLNGRVTTLTPVHPLAAGLAGVVDIGWGEVQLNWGIPGEEAIRIAAPAPGTDHVSLFAYGRGSALPGTALRAPARRVAFLLNTPAASRLDANGWRLFDAAVKWCLEGNGDSR